MLSRPRLRKLLLLALSLSALSGCVYEPYPPPPGPVFMAPGYYSYPEYPAYAYGPDVNVSFGRGGWGGHHWR